MKVSKQNDKHYEDIINACKDDRSIAFSATNIGYIKKNGIDILIKLMILMFNSIGVKDNTKTHFFFVDEVKNKNMSDNLLETQKVFCGNNEKTYRLDFYRIRAKDHVKIGVVYGFFQFLILVILTACAFVCSLGYHCCEEICIKIAIKIFSKYLKIINAKSSLFVIMTDYNFFSCIIAMEYSKNSVVIQHGLQMDDLLCYPIRAGRYCAWGNRSKKMLYNDKKISVTGTYKYNSFVKKNKKLKASTLLFCIGNLDYNTVDQKIQNTVYVCEKLNLKLKIKCHPGSLYDVNYWKSKYGRYAEIYKETPIEKIDFDIAITESSTAIIDFIMLNKPFILYDTKESYFGHYDGIVPRCESSLELEKTLLCNSLECFERANKHIIEEELNNGKCNIYEDIKNYFAEII